MLKKIYISSLCTVCTAIVGQGISPQMTIDKFVQRWESIYNNSAKRPSLRARAIILDGEWNTYHKDLINWLNTLPLTNFYTGSVKDNIKKALEALKNPFIDLEDAVFDTKKLKNDIDLFSKLSSKYNLGSGIARLGDESYIKSLKALLADKIIPNIIQLYQQALTVEQAAPKAAISQKTKEPKGTAKLKQSAAEFMEKTKKLNELQQAQ